MLSATAPGTVDDADMTDLCALKKHLQIISEGDPDYFYYCEGYDIFEEALFLGY